MCTFSDDSFYGRNRQVKFFRKRLITDSVNYASDNNLPVTLCVLTYYPLKNDGDKLIPAFIDFADVDFQRITPNKNRDDFSSQLSFDNIASAVAGSALFNWRSLRYFLFLALDGYFLTGFHCHRQSTPLIRFDLSRLHRKLERFAPN